MRTALLITLLFVSAPAHAQPWAYAAAIGGQALDAGSTVYKFHHGYVEGNVLYGGGRPTARVLATKAVIATLAVVVMRQLEPRHPRAARALGLFVGVAGAVPATINLARPNLETIPRTP